jgi:hypothetical protein
MGFHIAKDVTAVVDEMEAEEVLPTRILLGVQV